MAELGYLDDPGAHFGMLDLQLRYTAQLALDIGLHLELRIPNGTGWREGVRWDFHTKALSLGSLGLGPLRETLAGI